MPYAVTVGLVDEVKKQMDDRFASIHAEAYEKATYAGIRLHTGILVGHVEQSLVRYAAEGGFTLLVLGHSGHSGVWAEFLGTTPDKVSRHAPCSVLTVR